MRAVALSDGSHVPRRFDATTGPPKASARAGANFPVPNPRSRTDSGRRSPAWWANRSIHMEKVARARHVGPRRRRTTPARRSSWRPVAWARRPCLKPDLDDLSQTLPASHSVARLVVDRRPRPARIGLLVASSGRGIDGSRRRRVWPLEKMAKHSRPPHIQCCEAVRGSRGRPRLLRGPGGRWPPPLRGPDGEPDFRGQRSTDVAAIGASVSPAGACPAAPLTCSDAPSSGWAPSTLSLSRAPPMADRWSARSGDRRPWRSALRSGRRPIWSGESTDPPPRQPAVGALQQCHTRYDVRMTMLSFRVDEAEATEAQRWAERLGVDRSELLRDALRRHLDRLASENDAAAMGGPAARRGGASVR